MANFPGAYLRSSKPVVVRVDCLADGVHILVSKLCFLRYKWTPIPRFVLLIWDTLHYLTEGLGRTL